MPQRVTVRKLFALLKRARWFLTLLIVFSAVSLAWYGWHTGRWLVWITICDVFLLLLLIVVWGSKITLLLARRLEHQIVRKPGLSAHRLFDSGLQQREKLVHLGSRELEKNIGSAKQAMDQALNRIRQDRRGGKGKVTWITAPSLQDPGAICPACGQGVRSGAKFCDRCGKPLSRF